MSGSTTISSTGTTTIGSSGTYSVSASGVYDIVAYGSSGDSTDNYPGGFGAEIGGDFDLTAGETLNITVGIDGANGGGGGGGGGTFVVGPNGPLVIAGGGGGAGFNGPGGGGGVAGAGESLDGAGGAAGASGNGGEAGAGVGGGGGGGGLLTNGGSDTDVSGGRGGSSFGSAGPNGGGGGHSGGGGGGGYSGGGGGGGGSLGGGGGGGGAFDGGTPGNADFVLMGGQNGGNGRVVITPVVAQPSTIAGTKSGQATTDEVAIKPFGSVAITDPNTGSPTETVTVTPSSIANGTLSDTTGGTISNGIYTVSGSPSTVTTDLDALTFTPAAIAPGQTITTGFTITDLNSAGVTSTDTTTSVIATAPAAASTITGAVATQPDTGDTSIAPFAHVSITDPNSGTVSETVTVTPSSTANGTLSDTIGGAVNNGTYTVTGSPSTVTTDLNALTFTPAAIAPGQTITTGFTISDANSAGVTATDTTTSVIDTVPAVASTITGTQAGQATTDEAAIKPFASVTITDPNSGSPIDTVSIKASNSANGSLSDPNQTADGGVFDNGTYLLAGSASAVTADLEGLVFTPTKHEVAPGQTVTTGFTISDNNTATPLGTIATDNTTSVVATAVNDSPTITGTQAGQTTTDNTPITPFAGVSITDPDVGVQDSLVITLTDTGGAATDANGTLSGTGLTKTGTGTYALAPTSPASLSSELDALSFVPTESEVPAFLAVTTGFTLTASQAAGGSTVTTTDSTTSVRTIAAPRPSIISGTVANQPTTDEAAVRPFASVTITDPNLGSPMDSVSIRLSSTANGSLSDPNQAADGGVFNNGAYLLSGSASAVTADLDGLVFTPAAHEVAPGQTVTTGFTLSDLNSAIEKISFIPTTDSTTSVVATAVNDPPAITGTIAGQTTTDTAPVKPFTGVGVTDRDVGVQDSLVVTLTGSGGAATDANGALSGTGISKTGTGTYALAATSPANLSSELDALIFTPTLGEVPAGQTVTTGFTLLASQTAGGSTATSTDSTTAVITTATLNTVTGPAGGHGTLTGTSGADLITAQGTNNVINGKGGNDIINAGNGLAAVTLGNGNATVTLGGAGNVVLGGTGNTTVTGAPGGYTAVTLGNGNDTVQIGGSHDVIVLGTGTNIISGTQGMAFITTGAGNDTITLGGSGSTMNAGGGTNTITGGIGHDTFVLPKAGQGFDSITGFTETNGDVLDLRPALAATNWNPKSSKLGNFLKVTDNGGSTTLAIAPTGSGPGIAIAKLNGVSYGLNDLLSHHSLLT